VLRDVFKACCENPYDEGENSKYYGLAPEESLSKGGIAFMS
jgi:hypothetical protein